MSSTKQIFKDEITPIPYNLFQQTEAKGMLPNSFYEVSITPNNRTRQRNYKEKKKTTTEQYLS